MGLLIMARLDLDGTAKRRDDTSARAIELETVAAGNPAHRLIEGDNLLALRALGESDVRVHLAYLDPPFFTQRVHRRVKRQRNRKTGAIERTESPAFDDRWKNLDAYLAALAERITAVRQLLTDDGCIVIHIDPTTSHYVKVLCDEIFGRDAFASEIIWRYRRWPAKTPNFQKMHDVLLRYRRDPSVKPRFVQLYEPLAASTRATWGDRKQLAEVDEHGRRRRSTKTAEASPGTPMGDVWDLSVIAPVAKERTGYPTQKPEKLLTRLISSCSYEGDTILDPYAGSGTTLAVAAALGRSSIGIDESAQAIQVATERLAKADIDARRERVTHGDAVAAARG
jgi:DNA modification methylase